MFSQKSTDAVKILSSYRGGRSELRGVARNNDVWKTRGGTRSPACNRRLTRMFGIGLILFDRKKKDAQFEIRVRAARHEPDMFYVNKYLKMIEDDLFA